MKRNFNLDLYNIYEKEYNKNIELQKKYDKLKLDYDVCKSDLDTFKKNYEKNLKNEIEKVTTSHVKEINLLKNEIEKDLLEINRLKDIIDNNKNKDNDKDYTIDKLNNELNKDSTNSSISTSNESIKNSKKRRTNTYNHRTKSKNKNGGQFNHKGTTLTKEQIEQKIIGNKLPIKVIKHTITKEKYKKEIVKYKIGIKVNTYIEKHVFIPNESSNNILPKEFYSDVTYNNDIKTIILILGNYCSLPYNKIVELLSDLTNNIINLSEGTIDNIYEEFSNKCEGTLLNITNNLINGKFQHTDETVTKENGKDAYYRGYGNKENVIYKYHNNKGDKPIQEDNIITKFLGTLITDHEVGSFKYGKNNQDCVVHFGRHCIELDQNVLNIKWPITLYELLLKFERNRKILGKFGVNSFSDEEIKYMNNEYDAILKEAEEEKDYISSSYWKEKSNTLLKRCKKYKNQLIFFIYDFTIDYDNNFMERCLRMIKSKTKVSGGFRSHNGGVRFGNIMSIIKTSKLRNMNPFLSIVKIINGENLFA